MFKIRILALMVMAAILLLFPGVALGQQVPPHISAISPTVDGAPAADGAEVTAWIDGEQVATAMVENGVAVIVISGDAGLTGKTISFKVDGVDASETDTWEQGGHADAEFSITASSAGAGETLDISLFEHNHSGQSGSATLTETGGRTTVVMSLNPGAMKTELTRIHSGQCGDTLGGVVYPLTRFQGGSGASTTTVDDVTLAMLQNGDHAINLHQAGNPGTYTACGDIPKPGEKQGISGLMTAAEVGGEKGESGSAGAAGSSGTTGATGATGAAGSDGPAGEPGAAGDKGDTGDKGDQGVKGDAGAAGAAGSSGGSGLAIVSVVMTRMRESVKYRGALLTRDRGCLQYSVDSRYSHNPVQAPYDPDALVGAICGRARQCPLQCQCMRSIDDSKEMETTAWS